ncbi:MAG: dihydropteroate synthase [Candidatus Eisenbacteria bacterium]
MILRCRDVQFELGQRTMIMGIVNVTPDSFSDGGRFHTPEAAIAHAERLLGEGADILDLGAESTRPGAAPVEADEQLRRLTPVLEALRNMPGAVISVDTQRAEVAARALELGAHAINDISALGDADMAHVVAEHGAGLLLMHMQGTPETMQQNPVYEDVVREVATFLAQRRALAQAAGVADECIAVDPGLGFGKTLAHNLTLLASLEMLAPLRRPIVVGASRKGFLGALTSDSPSLDRLEASLAAAVLAAWQGASILRVHDVAATRRALTVTDSTRRLRPTR